MPSNRDPAGGDRVAGRLPRFATPLDEIVREAAHRTLPKRVPVGGGVGGREGHTEAEVPFMIWRVDGTPDGEASMVVAPPLRDNRRVRIST
ncbi:hypothetical protein [Nonomuraea sp. LPB2021202275-12-8]|uniref:hypothetical protein n=1 Tax=Nonomuraea sp. LPB2021202275-12-8 TaxID=3120159 RepID=UPI00300DB2A9